MAVDGDSVWNRDEETVFRNILSILDHQDHIDEDEVTRIAMTIIYLMSQAQNGAENEKDQEMMSIKE
ncbi:hypothetical protein N7541_008054 [Penicillium brevicompactum]|uniref:Uncharacterized protein n=1 Tax=Penicillium brevicompactum TaxID=5074 RepID=A0A9W9QYC7_PENBR|nr:hypothetical protein N7541_008054 [Penicillium brevicompactum]